MKDIFSDIITNEIINRIEQLTPTTKAQWGKMDAAQMLAHCNVTYEMDFENIHKKPGAFGRWMLKAFVKKAVVNEVLYKKNTRTAPQFLIKDTKDFEVEKVRLINYINQTTKLGRSYFEGKESFSFGKLTADEYNNMFYKHLDHHLSQFGV